MSALLAPPAPAVVVPEARGTGRIQYEDLPRLPVPLFGPLPEGYEEDPWDPAGQAD